MSLRSIARKLGLKSKPDRHDNVLVSFPKSGRTWLRVMLLHAGIPFKPTHAGTSYGKSAHWRDLPAIAESVGLERTVFLIRDPRDTAVSGYYPYTKRMGREHGDINSFVLDGRYGVAKIARFHKMIYDYLDAGGEGHLCSYEDFHRDTAGEFRALAEYFLGHPISESDALEAVEYGSFNNMQKMEITGELKNELGSRLKPKELDDPDSFKTRKGKTGSYRQALDSSTIEACEAVLEDLDYWTVTRRALTEASQKRDNTPEVSLRAGEKH
jgi:hypothetical protein